MRETEIARHVDCHHYARAHHSVWILWHTRLGIGLARAILCLVLMELTMCNTGVVDQYCMRQIVSASGETSDQEIKVLLMNRVYTRLKEWLW